jgi:hypothetical protein
MQKISEYCSFSSEEGDWNFLNKVITYENNLFPITDDSIKNLSQMNLSDNENISVINDNQSKIEEEINESLLIYVLTWNLHGKFPEINEFKKILPKTTKENSAENNYQKSRSFDLFVINTQECLRSIGASFFNSSKEDWENALKIHFGDEYINLVNSNLNSFHIAVFVKKEKINFFTELKTGFIKTGFMNVLGNKGAIGVSMKYQDKKMLFVCCHLSSGQTKSYARNNDFKKISAGLNLKPTLKFNKNLNDIKLGLKKGVTNSIYQSYLLDDEGEKNNFRSKYFQDLAEIKSSPQKLLKLKKDKDHLSPTKSSIYNDIMNDNIESILNSKNHKFNRNKDESMTGIHKKNTNNFLSKISNDNTYSNIKNMVSPKVDYLLIRGETNNNTTTKIISSNFDEQMNKTKGDNFEELEDTIGVNQYDLVIFSGDLNYRINMEIEDCKKILEAKDIETLLVKDQLSASIRSKEIEMDDFFEGQINFLPTYKFQDGTDNYDYNERVPGWTDRILYRANNLSDVILCKYSAIFEAKTSDHKPVYAIFKINFNSHEKNKEKYKKIEEGCHII